VGSCFLVFSFSVARRGQEWKFIREADHGEFLADNYRGLIAYLFYYITYKGSFLMNGPIAVFFLPSLLFVSQPDAQRFSAKSSSGWPGVVSFK